MAIPLQRKRQEAGFLPSIQRSYEISAITHPSNRWKTMRVEGKDRAPTDPKPGGSAPLIPILTPHFNSYFDVMDSIFATSIIYKTGVFFKRTLTNQELK